MKPASVAVTTDLDPLRQTVPLPLHDRFRPLGFPLELETNSPHVLQACAGSWEAGYPTFRVPPVRLRVAVDDEGPCVLPPIPVYRAHSHIFLIVSDAANYAVCDYTKRFAHCTLTPGALADRGWLLFYFLDALVYSLLAQLYTVPVHAACVSRSGRGVLLCGPSGAGKSSLAFACASREWTYVSDDASHVVRGRRDRLVVGRPSVFRFRESASDLFPELQGRPAERDGLGKMTMEVRTRDLRGIRTAASARVHHIVFLDRHAASPERLFRVDAAEALTRLWSVQHGFDPALREGQEACLRHLLETGSYGLRYRRLDAAVSMLEQLVVEGGPL